LVRTGHVAIGGTPLRGRRHNSARPLVSAWAAQAQVALEQLAVVVEHVAVIRGHQACPHLRAVGMWRSERAAGRRSGTEVRYFIGSRRVAARRYAQELRGHWESRRTGGNLGRCLKGGEGLMRSPRLPYWQPALASAGNNGSHIVARPSGRGGESVRR
jgi:hypothetical protein